MPFDNPVDGGNVDGSVSSFHGEDEAVRHDDLIEIVIHKFLHRAFSIILVMQKSHVFPIDF